MQATERHYQGRLDVQLPMLQPNTYDGLKSVFTLHLKSGFTLHRQRVFKRACVSRIFIDDPSEFLNRESGCIFASILIVCSGSAPVVEFQEAECDEDTFGPVQAQTNPTAARNKLILAAYA